MAKKNSIGKGQPKVAMLLKPPDNYDPHISGHGRKEKEGGIIYVLDEVWFAPGKMGPLQKGSIFKECNDGWYQTYNEKGNKMHYRVGPEIIKEVFNANE